jgi:alpha-1,2-mannosyltransferase
MSKLIPDLYIGIIHFWPCKRKVSCAVTDTMGYSFTFHIVKWVGGIPVGAYVHYPTISTDMLARVKSRKNSHTNSDAISSSSVLSSAKLMYYRLFMYYYSLSLRTASFLMVNSSWTKGHVDSILCHSDPLIDFFHFLPPLVLLKILQPWTSPGEARIVYPPCNTREIAKFSLDGRDRVILSVAQFRYVSLSIWPNDIRPYLIKTGERPCCTATLPS